MTFSFQRTRGRTMAPSRTTSSESRPPTQHTFPAFNATGSREYFPKTVHVCTSLTWSQNFRGLDSSNCTQFPSSIFQIVARDNEDRRGSGGEGGRIGLRKLYHQLRVPRISTSRIPNRCDFKNYGQKFRNSRRKKFSSPFLLLFFPFSRQIPKYCKFERTLSPFYNFVEINAKSFLPFRFPRQRFHFTIYIYP